MNKLAYLESLRGIAALVVVVAHFVVAFYPALFWAQPGQAHLPNGIELKLAATPLHLLYNGTFSVSIFFVLSGFVLTYKFFKDRETKIALVPIAAKRYTRLLVPVLFSNILAYVLLKFALYSNQPASVISKSSWLSWYWDFAPSIATALYESFIGVFFSHQASYNGVLWTMYFEFMGSMIVYAFIAIFGRHPRRIWFYLAAVLLFRRSYYLAFIFGMALSDIAAQERNVFQKIGHKSYFIALLLAGLFLGSMPSAIPLEGTLYAGLYRFASPRTWYIIGAAFVMIALLNSRRLQSLFSKRFFVFLGRISFSLYILHQLVLGSLASALFLRFVRSVSYHTAVIGSFIISLGVLFLASHYAHRFVDAKGIELAQWLYRLLQKAMKRAADGLLRLLPGTRVVKRMLAILLHPEQPAPSPSEQVRP